MSLTSLNLHHPTCIALPNWCYQFMHVFLIQHHLLSYNKTLFVSLVKIQHRKGNLGREFLYINTTKLNIHLLDLVSWLTKTYGTDIFELQHGSMYKRVLTKIRDFLNFKTQIPKIVRFENHSLYCINTMSRFLLPASFYIFS